MTDYLELQGQENEDALRRALRRLDSVPGEPWGGVPVEEGGPALGGPDLQKMGDGLAGPELVPLEMEDGLRAYGGPDLAPGSQRIGGRMGGPAARERVPPEAGSLEMEDGLRTYGELGFTPVLHGLGEGPGPGGPLPERDAPLPGPDAPWDSVPADREHALDRRTGQVPLLEELERLERAANSIPGPGAALRQTGGSDLSAGTWSRGGRAPFPVDETAPPIWTGPGARASSPAGELDRAELVDRAFRRDSRRYDGGFYLY